MSGQGAGLTGSDKRLKASATLFASVGKWATVRAKFRAETTTARACAMGLLVSLAPESQGFLEGRDVVPQDDRWLGYLGPKLHRQHEHEHLEERLC